MNSIEQSRFAFSELSGVVAVASHRSFRRAAAELGVSASALSHAIASLEERLGVRLFHRTTRSVSLSEAGARFVERVRPALGEIAGAMETVNAFRDTPAGTIRINTSLPAARFVLEPLVLPFLAAYPDITIDLVTEGRLVDIVAGGFDAGIRPVDLVPRDMVAVPCSPPIRFVAFATPAYLARHGTPRTPADLHEHACIRRRMPSGTPLRWEFAKGTRALEVEVPGTLVLDADELVIIAALRGMGLAWANEWVVAPRVAAGEVVTVLDDWSPPSPGLCLYYPAHQRSAALGAFADFVRARSPVAAVPPRGRTTVRRSSRRARGRGHHRQQRRPRLRGGRR